MEKENIVKCYESNSAQNIKIKSLNIIMFILSVFNPLKKHKMAKEILSIAGRMDTASKMIYILFLFLLPLKFKWLMAPLALYAIDSDPGVLIPVDMSNESNPV